MVQRQYFDSGGLKRTQALGWDAAGRLSAVIRSASPYSFANYFLYDADGARTSQLEYAGTATYLATIYPFPVYELEFNSANSTYTPTRYYMLNGQAIALRTGSQAVTYLHRDQVGSVVMTTQNGVITDTRQYFAYGAKRGGDDFPFEPDYTGQRRDGTGLMYYNARYYDPELGSFISPDSMIPDPSDFFSYNRYLYAGGNPLSNNDPTGHCPASSGSSDGEQAEYTKCWGLVDTINQNWDKWNTTNYWSGRMTSKDVLNQYLAPDPNLGSAFFEDAMFAYFKSDDFKTLPKAAQLPDRGSLDLGDYTVFSGGAGFFSFGVIVDDYGNIYVRGDNNLLSLPSFADGGIHTPGLTLARGDIFYYTPDSGWVDIDQLGLTVEEQRALAPNILVGGSRGGNVDAFYLNGALAVNSSGPPHLTTEAGITSSGISFSFSLHSTTFQIWPVWKGP